MNKILVIEDDTSIRSNVLDLLEAEGFEGIGATDGKCGIEAAVQHLPALIICDVMMPGFDGYEVLEVLGQKPETAVIPFIFLSARADRADVRKGMALGADDYLTKPFTRLDLLDAIRARLRRTQTLSEPPASGASTAVAVVAAAAVPANMQVADEKMRELLGRIERVAKGAISVLILGETGVGKEMIAEQVHRASGRKGRFVALSCAALPDTLLESELFGHERGAFTGAVAHKEGLIESAHGGTLFLDEVGDIPWSTQVKLLRVLESKDVTRLGGRAARTVDVRFVAATNRDIEQSEGDDGFRRDLYFRLNGITLHVPPLRERRADIEPLAAHFVAHSCRVLGRPRPTLARSSLEALWAHDWPGNIRELRNVMERAVLLCEGAQIEPKHLCVDSRALRPGRPTPGGSPTDPREQLMNELSELEKQRIVAALARCAGNQTMAAELLGISRRTLVTRLHSYELPRPRRKV